MGFSINNPKFSALDANGDPLVGGLLYTYVVGTTNAKATYTDKALTVPAANPVVLDSRGEAEIYGSGHYKLVLKTSAGATVWTIPDVEWLTGDTTSTATLANTLTLTSASAVYQILDPGGASRTVLLPAVTDGLRFWIYNATDSATEVLSIKDSTGVTTYATLNKDQSVLCICGASAWKFMLSTANLNVVSALTTEGSYWGDVQTVTVDTNGVGPGAALYMAADGHYDTCDADAAATMPCSALALESGTGSKLVLKRGYFCSAGFLFTPGGRVYVSTSTGAFTQNVPTGYGDQVQCVGVAESANILNFNPAPVVLPETYLRTFVGYFSINTTTATGTQTISDVGFQPKACFFSGYCDGGSTGFTNGFDDGTHRHCILELADANTAVWARDDSSSIIYSNAANQYKGIVSEFNAAGFIISWTKVNSPTGTLHVKYLAIG